MTLLLAMNYTYLLSYLGTIKSFANIASSQKHKAIIYY